MRYAGKRSLTMFAAMLSSRYMVVQVLVATFKGADFASATFLKALNYIAIKG